MSRPGTAREVLLAEAIGDLAKLLDRVETLAPAIDSACTALGRASAGMSDELAHFDRHMAAITQNAKQQTVRHLVRRTDEAARRTLDQQTRAMEAAAAQVFAAQVEPTLRGLVEPLQQLATTSPPGQRWLSHGATALTASVLTWLAAAALWAPWWRQA